MGSSLCAGDDAKQANEKAPGEMTLSSSSTLLMPSGGAPTITSSTAIASSSGSGGSNSPCAACKFLRRKCQPDCVFAPYFPPDDPQKFVMVHKVFGASNVTKLLNEIPAMNREDAVASLAYEAEMRVQDPVYGCVGLISILHHKIRQVQIELTRARAELSEYLQPININLQASATGGIIGGCDQIFPLQQQQQQQQMMMMMKRGSFDPDLAATYNANGAYGGVVASGSSSAAAPWYYATAGQFLKNDPCVGAEQQSAGHA